MTAESIFEPTPEQVRGAPIYTAHLGETTATLTAPTGERAPLEAAGEQTVEHVLMARIVAEAKRAGGPVRLHLVDPNDSTELLVDPSGAIASVPAVVPATLGRPAVIEESEFFAQPTRSTTAVGRLAVDEGENPGGTRIATRAIEPSAWGWRGWLNKLFNLKLAPGAKEVQERARQAANAKLDAANKEKLLQPLARTNGYCGYLTVASEKGGIGKSTVAALLAWTIAQRRQESVLVADLNPDLGSLADRLGVTPTRSIRDMVRAEQPILSHEQHPHEFLAKVPTANVWVLGGDTDADRREMTGEEDVKTVARVNRPFFAAGVLDNGTGISHSAMTGSLEVSHGMVIVLDNTRGVSKFAHSTLAHLEAKGYSELRQRVVVVVVESVLPPPAPRQEEFDTREQFARAQQAHAARLATHMSGAELSAEFSKLVRDVVVVPYDPVLAAGGAIEFDLLKPATVRAGDTLAAALLDDLGA